MQKTLYSLLILIATIVILWFGKGFFIPLVLGLFFGFFFMEVGEKVSKKTNLKKYKKAIAVVLLVLFMIALIAIFASLWNYVQHNWISMREALIASYNSAIQYFADSTIISKELLATLPQQISESLSFTSFNSLIGSTLGGMVNGILVVVYAILTILYRSQLSTLCDILLPKTKEDTLAIIKETVYNYAKGLFILVLIIGVLYYVGLLVVQTPYALQIAGAASLLTLVPTVGTFVGGMALVIATGLLTGSLWKAGIIFMWFMVIQQIEEFFILPKVVGRRVQINVLTSITSIVARGLLWGVAGVFLAIPIMGVIKSILESAGSKRNEVMST